MKNIQNNENNCQNTANNDQVVSLDVYLSGFDQPERALAFLEDILIHHASGEQWTVGGLIMMLDAIANQQSLEDVKSYVAKLQSHLLSDWTTKEMPQSVTRLRQATDKINW